MAVRMFFYRNTFGVLDEIFGCVCLSFTAVALAFLALGAKCQEGPSCYGNWWRKVALITNRNSSHVFLKLKLQLKLMSYSIRQALLTLLCILKDLLNKSSDFFHWCNWDFLQNSVPQVAHLHDKVLSPSAPLLHHKTSFPILNPFPFVERRAILYAKKPVIWIMLRTNVMEVQLLTGEYLPSSSCKQVL